MSNVRGHVLLIDYQLVGSGWASCTVKFGDEEWKLTASYLGDALAGLALGAVSILSGSASVSFGFDEEPGEYRWSIQRKGPALVEVQFLQFPDLWGYEPNAEGKLLGAFTCHPLEFAEAVESAALAVLAKHGPEGYKTMWVEHEFPSLQLELLKQYISLWRSWQE